MVKEDKAPHGYIYKATNTNNGKNYIGKTEKTIAERWSKHLDNAKELMRARDANPLEKISGTHLDNAINLYGPSAFVLTQEDVAYSKEELNELERHYVKEYDSMNPDKGYNMTEGGEGGVPSPEVIEKMTKVNQEIARNPETQTRMSKSLTDAWKNKEYQESVSGGVSQSWQNPVSREKYYVSKAEGKREIEDKEQFLKDIQEMKKKDINTKYEMDGKSINKRIEGMLGHKGVRVYSEAKKYLENKNIEDVLKEVRPSEKITVRKDIVNLEEFLEDIQKMQKKEINEKYGLNGSTVNKKLSEMLGDRGVHTYTGAKDYLVDKDIKEVVKDINERLNQNERHKGTTNIIDKKEFLKDIQNMKKYEITHKYDMDGKTINRRIEELLGKLGVKNYTEAKEYLKDKDIDEVIRDIEKRNKEKPELNSGEMKDKKESSSQENLIEKTDKNPKNEGKEESEEKPEEEKGDSNSAKNEENLEGSQFDEKLVTEEEMPGEVEEEIDGIDKEEIDKESSNMEEESSDRTIEEDNSEDSSNKESSSSLTKKNEDFDNLESSNLNSCDLKGIEENSSVRDEDFKGFVDGHDWESSESMDHIDDKFNEFDDFKGLGEDQGLRDSENIKSLDPHPVNKESGD